MIINLAIIKAIVNNYQFNLDFLKDSHLNTEYPNIELT
jgi:hypothetical protein